MKIKIKDEMDDIQLNVSHKELVVVLDALEKYNYDKVDIEEINNKVFDKDEFDNNEVLRNKIYKMIAKISNKLNKIYPY